MDSLRDNELKDAAKACAEALASLAEIGRELAFRLDSTLQKSRINCRGCLTQNELAIGSVALNSRC